MKTADLYQNYIALTAIAKALDRAGLKPSNSFWVEPWRGMGGGWTVAKVEAAVASYRVMPWLQGRRLVGFGLSDASIQMFEEGWMSNDKAERARALKALMREMPGEKLVFTEHDGSRIVAGIIHGQTYCIRIGILPGEVGETR